MRVPRAANQLVTVIQRDGTRRENIPSAVNITRGRFGLDESSGSIGTVHIYTAAFLPKPGETIELPEKYDSPVSIVSVFPFEGQLVEGFVLTFAP